jgi:hypothetical protein
VRNNSYGGLIIKALDNDDFSGEFCHNGVAPLVRAAHHALEFGVGCPE